MNEQTAHPAGADRDAVHDLRALLSGAHDLARRLDDDHLASRVERLQQLLDAVAAERPRPVVPAQAGPRDRRPDRPPAQRGRAAAAAETG